MEATDGVWVLRRSAALDVASGDGPCSVGVVAGG